MGAARRELAEEAHHSADSWHTLIDAFTTPGMSNEAIRIYLARDLTVLPEDERHHGEDEEHEMPVGWFALDEVVAAALAGHLHNPMAIMGSLAAWHARANGWAGLRPADAPWPARPALPGAAQSG